jgi:SAM-dependent methyltransferase
MSATPLRKSFRIFPAWLTNWIRLRQNSKKSFRQLEIGPGNERLPGFESLNILSGPEVDYVCDATRPLPFLDCSFDLIYSSHTLEHVPWYLVEKVLKEWVRILKKDGALEIWVPDGLKIAKAFVEGEEGLNRIGKWMGGIASTNRKMFANGLQVAFLPMEMAQGIQTTPTGIARSFPRDIWS